MQSTYVLLIEDNPADARLIQENLRDAGAKIELEWARSLADGLKRLATPQPAIDAVLLDLSLPDSHGFDTFTRVSQQAPQVPIIMLTGLDDQSLAEQAMRAGAQDYLVKGHIDGDLLVRAIRYAIERARAKQEIETSEARFRAIFQSSNTGIVFCDLEGHIIFGNDAYAQLVGIPTARLPGTHYSKLTHPDFIAAQDAYVAQLKTGERDHFDIETQYVAPGGQETWAELSVSVIRDSQQRPLNFVGVARDITARKRAEEDRRQLLLREQTARAQAETANRSKDQFLAMISHELRTPLTPILAAAELLKKDSADISEDTRFFLDLICTNAELEARLVDDLLDVASIKTGNLQIKPEVVDVHAVLNNALDVHRHTINGKRLEVFLELDAASRYVWADPLRLRQVFWNLIGNAAKFSEEGGWIRVLSANTADNHIQVEVRDNGTGMDPQGISRLFIAFEQGDMSVCRRYGGLGLGLVICKSMVEVHGGKIRATSDGLGNGSAFIVELPLLSDSYHPAPADQEPSPVEADQANVTPANILLVEDNEDIVQTIEYGLQSWDFDVQTVRDGKSALEVAEVVDFDLLIVDIGLPDISGWELLRQLKTKRDVKAIALSGFSSDEDKKQSQAVGFLDHLTKPITMQRLRKAIDDALAEGAPVHRCAKTQAQ